jgi:protein-disulfide isomerase
VSTTQWPAALTMPITEDRDHIQGPADAPVTLLEYGDYECPYCGAAYPIVKEVQARIGERLRFVFRNFPITTSHPHAERAAEAAEAAAAQGSFWRMHDVLYENQKRLTDEDLRTYAQQVGLDLDVFDRELAEHVHAARERHADVLRQRDKIRRLLRPRHIARRPGGCRVEVTQFLMGRAGIEPATLGLKVLQISK